MGSKEGIKEIKELVGGLSFLAETAATIMKDGKIGAEDLPAVITLLGRYDEIMNAFKGLSMIDEEIKDMDEAELVEVVKELFGLGRKIQGLL